MFKKILSLTLTIVHLSTFSPLKDALAFSSQSASYRLNSGVPNEGGGVRSRIDSDTKLLLHLDGADGSVNLKDELKHTLTVNGNSQIDTTQSKFGNSSGLFDGAGDYLTLADSDDWNFGSQDFTIDFWVRFNSFTQDNNPFFLRQKTDSATYLNFSYQSANNQFLLYVSDRGTDLCYAAGAFKAALNTWYHVGLVRDKAAIKMFVDGAALPMSAGPDIGTQAIPDFTGPVYLSFNGSSSGYLDGWLDELRISKGIARWTSNFTPPQAPYNLSGDIPNSLKLTQDTLGESAADPAQSPSYSLNSGFIPTVQANPPIQTQTIPNLSWPENTSKLNAFDLDDYFTSEAGGLTYTSSGATNIQVTIASGTDVVSFSQTPDYFGTERIRFTATDSEGNSTLSNEVTLQVEGVNNPPVLAYIPDVSVNETDLVTITPSATDLDNDPITYSFSAPLDAAGKWQTDYTSSGTYTVTVTAADSTGLTDTQTVLVNVRNVNRKPVLALISDITADEGGLVTVNPVASDPDNDPVTFYYSAPLDSQGKWLTGYADAGAYTATVTASDGIDTVSQAFTITIKNTNRVPKASLSLSQYTVNPNEEITITLTGTDPDSDSMTFSLKKDGVEIAAGALGQTYTFNTSFTTIGDHTITATVIDSGGLSSTDSKAVDVVNPNANRAAINPLMGDFNGDALTDLGLHNSETGTWEIALSNKGVFSAALDWLTNFGVSKDWLPVGGDFDGDAKTDIGIYNNTTGELKIALSNGSSFSPQSAPWLSASFASYSWQPFTGNFNADKYTDFALYNQDTGEVKVALGTGSGFGSFNSWLNNSDTGYIALSGDFNGDSLSDLCLFKKTTGEFKVVFSNSSGFVDGASWLNNFAVNFDPLISDFNNDGLTDVGYWDKTNSNWHYAISTGERFIDKGIWQDSFGSVQDELATTGDFDGNGITDRATFDRDNIGQNRWRTQLSTLKPADLLAEADNGIGGKTKISYTYAADSDNPALPFPVYVASEISLVNDFPNDRAATYAQLFTFSGGYYDASEREFRGFAKVKVRDPLTNNYTETYFYQGKPGQDGALKGQIEKVLAYDGNNRQISQTLNTYEVRKSGPENSFLGFPALIETATTVYEENASSLTTKDKFTYDNIGNLLSQTNEGDTLKTGDDKTIQTTYAVAYEQGLPQGLGGQGFNRPLETLLKDKDGAIISKKTFEYDEKGNLIQDTTYIFNPLSSLILHSSSFYSYDSLGNLTSTTDALGRITTTDYETTYYTYPEKSTNSLGQSVSYVYEPKFGVLLTSTDPNGLTAEYTYDSLGRLLKKNFLTSNFQLLTSLSYTYPDFNTKVTTNALGFSKTDYLDGLGRKYKTVSNGEDGAKLRQVSSESFFNSRGLLEKESLPHYIDEDEAQLAYTKYEYDLRGRIKKTIADFPGSLKDAKSQIDYISPLYTETTDPEGHKKGIRKDVFGNTVEVTEFTSSGVFKTNYEYDLQNNLTKTTDNQANSTQIFYDSIGRKLKMIDPDMGTWLYEYDLLGNLTKQTDAKNQILEFEYDSLNRLVRKVAKSQGHNVTSETTYLYDDILKPNCIGRLSKVTDSSGSTEFFYDNLGREIKSIKTIANLSLSQRGNGRDLISSTSYTVQREYDILDRLTKLTYPDGEAVSYNYDTNSGLLEKVYGAKTYVQDISYNAQGQIKTIQYGNGVTTDYTYGQDLRLSQILTRTPVNSQTLQDLNYLFDHNGNITTLTDNLKSNIRTYAYDDLDRLTDANNLPAPGGGYANYNYQYDSIGNMTYKSDLGVMNYGVGAGPHALTSAGGYTYSYDANGNMTSGKNKTLEYDQENRLTKVSEPTQTTSFTYDGDGGRVKKLVSSLADELISETTYIGSLYEKDSDGTIRKHIFAGANRVASVSLRGSGTAEAISYYHSDHLGSSNIITDKDGKQAASYEYTPYGSLALSNTHDSIPNTYLFTGKELDSTNLYFYGARYYDPELGRFISADSIVQAPYDPQSLNRYSYCRNNPMNYVDPTGHSWWKKIAGFFGAVVGTIAGIATGNPFLGMMTYSLIAASGQRGNFSQNFGINFASSLAGFVVGVAAGGIASNLFAGNYWPGLIGSAVGGAAGGAATSAMLGGDVGMGALAGLAGGTISYAGGYVWPLGADAVTGGVSSVIMGGDFGEGAAQGAYYNMANTVGGILAPMPTLGEQNPQPGDVAYLKADSLQGLAISLFEGGPFSHVGTVTDQGLASTNFGKNSGFEQLTDYNNRGAYVYSKYRGNQSVINTAKALAMSTPKIRYGFFPGQKVCSTITASVLNKAGYSGWYGIGPNSQQNAVRTYGEE